MAKTYQSDGCIAFSAAERILQAPLEGRESLSGVMLLHLLVALDVTMYYVELDGEEQSGPWLSKRAAQDYIDTHICERGVCDDAYDRVMQEYAITDADGNEVE